MALNLKQQIEQDLKTALLAGDKELATILRGLKSTILYEEVAKGKRDSGLEDGEVIRLLTKEAAKRQESADLYQKGGDKARADAELAEKAQIEKYLPARLDDSAIVELVDKAEAEMGPISPQNMGQVIGWVKAQSGGAADGAKVAELVKERLPK